MAIEQTDALVTELMNRAPTDTSEPEAWFQSLRDLKGEAYASRVLHRYVLNARKERVAMPTKRGR